MAWNKLPKSRPMVAELDRFDMEAEGEGNAIRTGPQTIGPVGKKIAKIRRSHDRGYAINEIRATRHIEVA
jgi:hypothetical protein